MSYDASMQKIQSDETKDVEEVKVPSILQGQPVGDYMVFKRPEADYTKYVRPDPHLLKFGGTEFGSVEMVGQPGDQECWLNAQAGAGTSTLHSRFIKLTCTADTQNIYAFIEGRGISA